MKLLIVSKKIWIFSSLLVITSISFLVWIGSRQIERKITVFLEKGDSGTKLIVKRDQINYVINVESFLVKINNMMQRTSIKNIYFDHKNDYYELVIDYFWQGMPHAIIPVEVIYSKINVFSYIFLND